MASKKTVVLISDLTGEEMAPDEGETVQFSLDGVDYEIDLFNDQADALRDAIEPYVEAARRTGGRAKRGTTPKTTRQASGGSKYSRDQLKHIREWARGEGFTVNDRGRVPREVLEAWEKAHQGAAA